MKVCRVFCKRTTIVKILDFNNFDDLADCTAVLYRQHGKRLESRLYKMPQGYRLLIYAGQQLDLTSCREFGNLQNGCSVLVAYTEEYGKLLIYNRAVMKIGSAFFKRVKAVSKI